MPRSIFTDQKQNIYCLIDTGPCEAIAFNTRWLIIESISVVSGMRALVIAIGLSIELFPGAVAAGFVDPPVAEVFRLNSSYPAFPK